MQRKRNVTRNQYQPLKRNNMQTKERKPRTANAHQIRQGWAEKYFRKLGGCNYARVPSYDASYYRSITMAELSDKKINHYSIKEWRAVKWLRKMVSRIRAINRK